MAVALMALAVTRVMAVTVQDRVIRLEMRLRLMESCPPTSRPSSTSLNGQFVALAVRERRRAAGPCARCLGGQPQSQKAIKERVKNWQGDFLRA